MAAGLPRLPGARQDALLHCAPSPSDRARLPRRRQPRPSHPARPPARRVARLSKPDSRGGVHRAPADTRGPMPACSSDRARVQFERAWRRADLFAIPLPPAGDCDRDGSRALRSRPQRGRSVLHRRLNAHLKRRWLGISPGVRGSSRSGFCESPVLVRDLVSPTPVRQRKCRRPQGVGRGRLFIRDSRRSDLCASRPSRSPLGRAARPRHHPGAPGVRGRRERRPAHSHPRVGGDRVSSGPSANDRATSNRPTPRLPLGPRSPTSR